MLKLQEKSLRRLAHPVRHAHSIYLDSVKQFFSFYSAIRFSVNNAIMLPSAAVCLSELGIQYIETSVREKSNIQVSCNSWPHHSGELQ